MVDVEALAREHAMPKCANVILLGAAARFLNILTVEQLRGSVARIFAAKGEAVVEMNQRAFDIGHDAALVEEEDGSIWDIKCLAKNWWHLW